MWRRCKICAGSGSVQANSQCGPYNAQCSACDGHAKVCECGGKLSYATSTISVFDPLDQKHPKQSRTHHMKCKMGHTDIKSVLQRSGAVGPYMGLYNDIWYSKKNLYFYVLIKEDVRHTVEFAYENKSIREWLVDPRFISYAITNHVYIVVDRDTGLFRQSAKKWGRTPTFYKSPEVALYSGGQYVNYKVIKLPFDFSKAEVCLER